MLELLGLYSSCVCSDSLRPNGTALIRTRLKDKSLCLSFLLARKEQLSRSSNETLRNPHRKKRMSFKGQLLQRGIRFLGKVPQVSSNSSFFKQMHIHSRASYSMFGFHGSYSPSRSSSLLPSSCPGVLLLSSPSTWFRPRHSRRIHTTTHH